MSSQLSRQEATAYLANVLAVAQVSGESSRNQALVLKNVVDHIGADQHDMRTARALLSKTNYKIHLLAIPEMRVSNLEDMVMMALADNKVNPHEAEPIEKLAKALNYTQADVDMLVRRAQGKLQKMIGHTDQTTLTPPLPKRKESVRMAVRKPRQQYSPSPIKREKIKRTLPPAEQKPIEQKPVEISPPATQHAANPVVTCQQARDASPNPREYCFGYGSGRINTWGCRLLGMDWAPGAGWFRTGYFRDDNTFVFDKAALVKRVTNSFKTCRNCPHINIDHIESAFDLLPSRASTIGRWTHHQADRNSSNSRNVQIKENIHGCLTRRQIMTDGVDPVGVRGALNIIKRAVKKTGATQLDYKLFE